MKKILIATSALVALSATSAYALEVTTSGTIEYRYNKNKIHNNTRNATEAQNASLSRQKAEVKFQVNAASDGLAYGAYVKVKTNDAVADRAAVAGRNQARGAELTTNQSGDNRFLGWTQQGRMVAFLSEAGNNDDGWIIQSVAPVAAVTGSPKDNATTQSAFWVSGAWGRLIAGQDGSAAADLDITGLTNAASFEDGFHVAEAGYNTKSDERITYVAPTFIDGLNFAYTYSFKGNTNVNKTDANGNATQTKAPENWGIRYATQLMGVGIAAAYVEGKTGVTGGTNRTQTIDTGTNNVRNSTNSGAISGNQDSDITQNYTVKQRKNTGLGVELNYGNFTVGYGTFENEKQYFQTKDTEGTNYGVKYDTGAWAVSYTVMESEDKNRYYNGAQSALWNKKAETDAIGASYTVAQGFSVYASRSSNTVTRSNGTKAKNNYTIIGAKIAF